MTHVAANIFPMDEDSLPSLADDIKANGLKHPIELLDGKVLDGRRRLTACGRKAVGVSGMAEVPSDHRLEAGKRAARFSQLARARQSGGDVGR